MKVKMDVRLTVTPKGVKMRFFEDGEEIRKQESNVEALYQLAWEVPQTAPPAWAGLR